MTTIKPDLKRLHSPDVFDLDNASIKEDEPFCVLIQAMFAPEGVDGEESFDIVVCNALWVAQEVQQGPFSGRHHLFVDRFDITEIRAFLEQAASQSTGKSWEEAGEKLARHGHWEFEDYVEYQGPVPTTRDLSCEGPKQCSADRTNTPAVRAAYAGSLLGGG